MLKGQKELTRQREVWEYHLKKCRAIGQFGFQIAAVFGQSMRHEGGATEKCKIKKGLVNHTRKFEFYPKGN